MTCVFREGRNWIKDVVHVFQWVEFLCPVCSGRAEIELKMLYMCFSGWSTHAPCAEVSIHRGRPGHTPRSHSQHVHGGSGLAAWHLLHVPAQGVIQALLQPPILRPRLLPDQELNCGRLLGNLPHAHVEPSSCFLRTSCPTCVCPILDVSPSSLG